MVSRLCLAVACLAVALPVTTVSARDYEPYRRAVAVETRSDTWRTREVIIPSEVAPVIRGEATQIVVGDLTPGNRVVRRPIVTIVDVSTDPYDHRH